MHEPATVPDQPALTNSFDIDVLPLPVAPGCLPALCLSARTVMSPEELTGETGQALRDLLIDRPALLVRGLRDLDARSTDLVASGIFPAQPAFHTGEHPLADGSSATYQPVRFSPQDTLLWHHENAFNATWPTHIVFTCSEPAAVGGHTTLVDSRLVYKEIPRVMRDQLQVSGVRYGRWCDGRGGRSWQQLYRTEVRGEAERIAQSRQEDLRFTADGAQVSALRPAFLDTGDGQMAWFNQILHWHPRALPADIRALTLAGHLPAYRRCQSGDGADIPDQLVDALVEVHAAVEFPVPWQAGDVLLIDNRLAAHGRRPYQGPRTHFVRMTGAGGYPRSAAVASPESVDDDA